MSIAEYSFEQEALQRDRGIQQLFLHLSKTEKEQLFMMHLCSPVYRGIYILKLGVGCTSLLVFTTI